MSQWSGQCPPPGAGQGALNAKRYIHVGKVLFLELDAGHTHLTIP